MRLWKTPEFLRFGAVRSSGLTVLAYHRVGDREATAYDPWVFTVDQMQLEAHIRYFQKHHRIVDIEEALEIAAGRQKRPGSAVLLTFDDGYLDNYEAGLPVLRSLNAHAVFFLTTSYLAGDQLAWWDRMAWLVRTAKDRRFRLPLGGETRELDLRFKSPAEAIKEVLDLYKACNADDALRFAESLESASRSVDLPPPERLFLGPEEAREMSASGMTIGAHSHSHPILAQMSPDEQFRELSVSRAILEAAIGSTVDVMAYPVGGPGDFTPATRTIARDCGYRAAFSCHGGANAPEHCDLFDIKRTAVYWGAEPAWLLDH